MYNHLVQQITQQKVELKVQQKVEQKVHNNYVALLIKQFVFLKLVESPTSNTQCKLQFCMLNKTKTQRKLNFSINFTVQHVKHFVVHLAVQFCAVL